MTMLILERKISKRIMIGEDITVQLLDTMGRSARLFVNAGTDSGPVDLHVGETSELASDIHITLLSLKDHSAKLGIDAPKVIPVHREEIYDRIREEERAAMAVQS